MKKTRIISMFLAVALVVSCFSVVLTAAPVELIFPGQTAELALGDWTGVIQSNPQNTSAATGGYLAVETSAYPQGVAITTSDSAYTLDSTKAYTMEIKMRTAAAGTSYYRLYCGAGAYSALGGTHEITFPTDAGDGFAVQGGDWVVLNGDLVNIADGQLTIKIHGGVVGVAYGDSFDVDYIKITEKGTDNVFFYEDFDDADVNCTYEGINGAANVSVKGTQAIKNGYVHVGSRQSYVSGASYTSNVSLTAGQTYTLTMRMRSSEADEYVRAFAGGAQAHVLLNGDWSNVTIRMTPAANQAFSLYFHGGYGAPAGTHHSFADFDIDSMVLTDSTGAKLIDETYDNGVGAWTAYVSSSYAGFQGSVISHGVDDDYATVPGSVATYTPAEDMNLKAGTYLVTGTFKVPYSRANVVVARAFYSTGAVATAPTTVIADHNKINVGVEIEDVDGNIYYAEKNSVPVATEWVDVYFYVEIPNDIVVKNIKFIGKDGVAPVAGTYTFGGETVTAGLLKDIYDDSTADDEIVNSPMLVQIAKQDGSFQNHTYMKSNYSTIAGADGFLADKNLPFQFCNADITMISLKPTEATGASSVGILAMLLLRRAANSNNEGDNSEGEVTDNPEVVGDKYYLRVETTAYPQGVEFVTEDSAYVLDANKQYTLEIKMRTDADTSYYRAYCGAGPASGLLGNQEIMPVDYATSGNGFPVAAGDWVVKSGDLRGVANGQLAIKIHGGAVGGVAYGDSFDIDYIKVTEKLTGNVFFYEDFEDDEFNCTFNAINGAVGAAVKGE